MNFKSRTGILKKIKIERKISNAKVMFITCKHFGNVLRQLRGVTTSPKQKFSPTKTVDSKKYHCISKNKSSFFCQFFNSTGKN